VSKHERQEVYIAALKECRSVPLAMRALDPPAQYRELARWRQDAQFRTDEELHVGRQPRIPEMDRATQKAIYLDALVEYEGNSSAARELAGLKKRDVDAMRLQDSAFKEAEDAVWEKIGDDIQETAMRGAKSGKDLGHTMKVLGKLRKEDWGEEPKRIDHRHSGAIVLRPLAEQIAELEADDGLDLLQPPD
jgi:hypothetical protein